MHSAAPDRPLRRAALACLTFALVGSPLAALQDRAAKPDQVFARHRRTGVTSTLSGTVKKNDLSEVVLETRSDEEVELESALVQRIVYGDVPESFVEAGTYADRGEYEEAAVQYRLAVDESSRGVVRAEARLRAAEALLALGSQDPLRLEGAAEEARRFLGDFPESRSVPRARMVEAQAVRLTGDAARAATLYRELYEAGAGSSPVTGYPLDLSYRAGELAVEAYLAAGDPASARALGSTMAEALPGLLAELEEDDPALPALRRASAHATLVEGFALLAEGQAPRARTFFDSLLTDGGAEASAALTFGARLGRAQALLAEGKAREAQLEFALVAGADYTDENRTAAALLGLARSASELSDPGAPAQIRTWLETIGQRYSETPSGPAAREMLAAL